MLRRTTLTGLLFALTVSLHAQTYYLMSEMEVGTYYGPPYPMNPCLSCPVYPQGNNIVWVDDRNQTSSRSFSSTSMMSSDGISPSDGSANGTSSPNVFVSDASYLTNGSLWIEAYSNDTQNIYLQLHNTTNALSYQLWSATNVASPSTNWIPGQFQLGFANTNITVFNPVPMTNTGTFFRGQQASTVIFIGVDQNAIETNATLGIPGQPGAVEFDEVPALDSTLTVYYTLSGSAQNGTDYTNLSGVVTIPSGQGGIAQVFVQPIDPSTLTNPIETVVFTIQPNTNYLVNPNPNSATVLIKSSSTTVFIYSDTNAIRPAGPGQPAQDGDFILTRSDDFGSNPPVTVDYQISGTATNGVDYQLLSDSITLAQDCFQTNITIVPLAENPPQGIKTLTLTLLSTNGYVADPNNYSATIDIYDQTDEVSIVDWQPAINANGPSGAPAQNGSFSLSRSASPNFYPEMTVNYSLGGQASNGVDYATLSGTVTFDENQSFVTIPLDPISNWTNASKSVIMTILPGEYVIQTNPDLGLPVVTNFIDNSSTEISVIWLNDAVEPQGTNAAQPGVFRMIRTDSRGYINQLSVIYRLSGSATNGVDYTNLSGVVTFAPGATLTNIVVQPLVNSNYPGDKTVILSLIPTNYYFINTNVVGAGTNFSSALMLLLDNNILFQTVTNGLPHQPTGMDYHPFLTNLLFSVESGFLGSDFERLGTNITQVGGNTVTNITLANWSTINVLADEVYLTVVTNNSSGFTNGDMFFGSNTGIGWLSSNAAASNLNWCVLSNAIETNAILLRGGLCMDTTGAFSNNIIAVTSDGNHPSSPKGVWEVDSHGNPTLLMNISATVLEGVAVVRTNFGPWSKNIITGDEDSTFLYTVDTNRILTSVDSTTLFPFGIHSESIQVIPPNESLYICDTHGSIMKLSKNYFTNYAGDLLIEDGEINHAFFIIHWDTAGTNFITRRIRYTLNDNIEHSVFAPIELPAH